MTKINIPQSSFLITRMLDEIVAFIVTLWKLRDEGVDELEIGYEGENPISRLEFMEKHFDPYRHVNIKDFMVNLSSYLSELIRTFQLDGIGEMGILMDYLKQNVDNIHYMGSVISRINNDKKQDEDIPSDFY